MQLSPLCSGSSGNATYVEMGGLRLLVDAGATGRRIEALLGEAGASAGALDGERIEVGQKIRGHGAHKRSFGEELAAAPQGEPSAAHDKDARALERQLDAETHFPPSVDSRSASSIAARTRSRSARLWAAETNSASNWAGAASTPRSSRAR